MNAISHDGAKETARVEAFSDGVFAIAITLLILEIRVPSADATPDLSVALARLWPSYLAYVASFMTIGVMWVNHHRLFTLIHRSDDTLMGVNLLLLFGETWIPFPTALLAAHLGGPGERVAAVVYATSFFYIAFAFALLRGYAARARLMTLHTDARSIARQYASGPLMYLLLIAIAYWSGIACLVVSLLYAIYFALPPRLWRREPAPAAEVG
jgi:uncharacterized membrane protein